MELQEQIKRLERKIDVLTAAVKEKETWVKVGLIREATGWDAAELRAKRESGAIKMKRKNGEIFYLFESIPEYFLKH